MAFFAKISLFFKQGETGWQEVYYKSVEDYTTAEDAAFALADFRGKCLASADYVRIAAIRISNDAIRGDARLYSNFNYAKTPGFQSAEVTPDPSYSSLLIRYEAGAEVRRPLYLRGMPDTAIADPFAITLSPEFLAVLSAYLGHVVNNGYLVKHLDKTVGNPTQKIATVVPDGVLPGTWRLGIPNPASFEVGQTAVVSGIREQRGFSGRFPITEVFLAGPRVSVFIDQIVSQPNPYLGKGTIRKLAFLYADITRADIRRPTHKDTGLPFDLRRGRRRIGSR